MRGLLQARAPTPDSQNPALSQKHRQFRVPKENLDPNYAGVTPGTGRSLLRAKPRGSPLPPRPLVSSVKRRLVSDGALDGTLAPNADPDSGVHVLVRVRPRSEKEGSSGEIVDRISPNTISVLGHDFVFDSVADSSATQDDIFRAVGIPLVENCLAGFNSSIFAYGQTGSGKTYTMWGSGVGALLEEGAASANAGLAPRVFEQLFSRLDEEKAKHADKQLSYQCCCSFLEIYNEQITDLLEPSQKNLQIREDSKTGIYIESLTVEYICGVKDVIRLLLKGLANRRTGATSINSESSRSHCVFTCIIRSQCKNVEGGVNSVRTSRINLVDLAGSERQKLTNARGNQLKEAGNINRSLSQLGNLINILAEVSQSGKPRHIPYRDSKLTFLLQESLGGNAKLAMICAVSPSARCKNETLSTLRFAKRAKDIKNKAIVNETIEDDVHVLRAQIKQLKDELVRAKSGGGNRTTVTMPHRSSTFLRMSFGIPKSLPTIQDDSDEEMEIDENDCEIAEKSSSPRGSNCMDQIAVPAVAAGTPRCEDKEGPSDREDIRRVLASSVSNLGDGENSLKRKSMLLPPQGCEGTASPTQSTSPLGHSKKSLRTSTSLCASQGVSLSTAKSASAALNPENILQISGCQRRSAECQRLASASLSAVVQACGAEVGVQTDVEALDLQGVPLAAVIPEDDGADTNLQLVLVDRPATAEKIKKPVLKAIEKVLAGAIRREMALDELCIKQQSHISHLNRLVQQHKHERECNAVIAQMREDKLARLEALMDGIITKEDYMQHEFTSLLEEHKILQRNYENHPELLRLNVEIAGLREAVDRHRNYFEMGEREVLLEELHNLRNQLQFYMLSSSSSSSSIAELQAELEESRSVAEKLRAELESEKKCSEELNAALRTAVQGHVGILEQYADLQEKHISLLATHRRISDGIEEVKRTVSGSECVDSLAAEVSVLRVEREKERTYWRDQNNILRAQLRDAAAAAQAAGELLARLKDAEQATALAQKRALTAEEEKEKAYQEILKLKQLYGQEIQRLSPDEPDLLPPSPVHATVNAGDAELSPITAMDPSSWFAGSDLCNI